MRTPGAANWTPELEDELRVHWANGESASKIAEAMGGGLTRNSIIGKANRMSLPGRRKQAPRTAPRSRRAITTVKTAREMTTAVKLGRAKKAGALTLEEALLYIKPTGKIVGGAAWEALPDTSPVSLLALSDETCRWPIGDPLLAGFGFCGCPVEEGRVYCPTHRALGTTQFKATAEDKRKLEKSDLGRRVFA